MKALGIVWGAELGSYVPANTCMLNLISCGWSLVNLMRFYSRQKRREVRHGASAKMCFERHIIFISYRYLQHLLILIPSCAVGKSYSSFCYLKLGVVKVHEGLPQVWSKFCHLQVLDSLSGRCCRTDFGLQIDCLWEAGSSGYLLHLWSGAWVCPPPDIRLPLRQAGLDCIPKYETTGKPGRAALNLCWDLGPGGRRSCLSGKKERALMIAPSQLTWHAWNLWNERNRRVFKNQKCTMCVFED